MLGSITMKYACLKSKDRAENSTLLRVAGLLHVCLEENSGDEDSRLEARCG